MPEARQPLDGKSVVPVLRDGSQTVRDHAYHCFPKGKRLGRAIRTPRYRFVEWKPIGSSEAPEYELYDYMQDPLETKNLVAARPDVVAELASLLASHPPAKPPARLSRR